MRSAKEPARTQVYETEQGPQGTLSFFEKSPAANAARSIYLKIYIGGTVMMILTIFGILSIYWGALYRTPERNLKGWLVVRVCSLDCTRSSAHRYNLSGF